LYIYILVIGKSVFKRKEGGVLSRISKEFTVCVFLGRGMEGEDVEMNSAPVSEGNDEAQGVEDVAEEVDESKDYIQEGLAKVLKPKGNAVFYNRAQVVNRDLSISVIQAYIKQRKREAEQARQAAEEAAAQNEEDSSKSPPKKKKRQQKKKQDATPKPFKPLQVLEALSATGLRSIRYFKEIDGIERIVANDWDKKAVNAIKENIEFNNLDTEKQIKPNCGDARLVMLDQTTSFDVIDLDPYGTAAPFLPAAIEGIADNGLILVTCTDMRNLAGSMPEACFGHYGSMPLRARFCNEMALRIVLQYMQLAAARCRRVIEPLMSLSIDFYVRIFARVRTSAMDSHFASVKSAYVYECTGCSFFALQRLGKEHSKTHAKKIIPANGPPVGTNCQFCGGVFRVGGPIYCERLHNQEFMEHVLEEIDDPNKNFKYAQKIKGIVLSAQDELPDAPFFYDLPSLCHTLKCTTPKGPEFRSAIVNAGYEVSASHCNPSAIKTTAPMSVIWDILKDWVKQHPVKNLTEVHAGYRILQQPSSLEEVDWTVNKDQKRKGGRFHPNPETNWGPLARAGSKKAREDAEDQTPQEHLAEKAKRHQGKRKRKQGAEEEQEQPAEE
jgi:tRNA (guanine26-N2/guanine27-N2)-dimethyltransferase